MDAPVGIMCNGHHTDYLPLLHLLTGKQTSSIPKDITEKKSTPFTLLYVCQIVSSARSGRAMFIKKGGRWRPKVIKIRLRLSAS
jgi:hypothetical protein